MNGNLQDRLQSAFPDAVIAVDENIKFTVTVSRDAVLSILSYLKDLGFNFLTLVSCVDWIEEEQFEIIYILRPYMINDEESGERERSQVIVKTRMARSKPEFQTVTSIFENAEPYERELHELFGINFQGHRRQTPLLLERDYHIPPFRKDFDTRQYVKDVFENIPAVEERKE